MTGSGSISNTSTSGAFGSTYASWRALRGPSWREQGRDRAACDRPSPWSLNATPSLPAGVDLTEPAFLTAFVQRILTSHDGATSHLARVSRGRVHSTMLRPWRAIRCAQCTFTRVQDSSPRAGGNFGDMMLALGEGTPGEQKAI